MLRSPTAAAGGVCALSIRADGLDHRWTGELDALATALAGRNDIDGCASIVLERADPGARVIVVLKDGRSSERTVSDPLDLRAVVTALVLLPGPEMATPREDAQRDGIDNVPPTRAPASEPAAGDHAPAAAPMNLAGDRSRRIELGGLGGTRWSGSAPAGTVGVFANATFSHWVLGAHGRWDSYAATSGLVEYTTQALVVGADLGREFRVGATSLSIVMGPSFVALSQKLRSNPPSVYIPGVNPKSGTPIGSVTPSAREGQVLRIGGAVRWNALSLRPMTLFVEADTELDVTSDAGNTMPAVLAATNPLPMWSAGLSLGGAIAVWP
jgi:hypothetical protein